MLCHFKNTAVLTLLHKSRNCCRMFNIRHEGKECNLRDTEPWLGSFQGGQINYSKDDNSGIAHVILNHPSKRNAMSGSMMVELKRIVDDLENWHTGKAVILRGEDAMFCSGGDLDFARSSAGVDAGFKMALYMHDVLSRLKALPFLSVALIHGKGAIGGGAEIAVACDWRLMTSDCHGIGLVHSRMGIVPAWGGSTHLASIVGYHQALELLCSGRVVPQEQALKIGLLNDIVDRGLSGNGLDNALVWLRKRTQAEPQVIHSAKTTLLNFYHKMDFPTLLSEERRLFAPLWGGPANKRALSLHIKHNGRL